MRAMENSRSFLLDSRLRVCLTPLDWHSDMAHDPAPCLSSALFHLFARQARRFSDYGHIDSKTH